MNEHRDPGPIDWRYDAADQVVRLIEGPGRSRVWTTAAAAVISCHGDATTVYNFTTPEEAKTWCEGLVPAL